MTQLLSIAIAITAGLMMTRVVKLTKLHFPDVTAYLVAGVLIGPYFLGRLGIDGLGFASYESVEGLSMISSAALGFIAFTIGNEFRLTQLRSTGKQAIVVGIMEAGFATALVDAMLIGLHFVLGDTLPIPAAITLGAIAAATAPAATLMVVRQYKAKGPVTELLLQVVALDDAIGLIIFAISFGVARALQGGEIDTITVFVNPMLEIVLSLLLGSILGTILTFLEKYFYSNSNRLSLTIAFVLLTVAVSMVEFQIGPIIISFSSLLVCMMLGMVFCNLCPLSSDLMERADRWTAPLFCLFFVLSGAELELGVFKNPAIIGIGVVYILTRSFGKYLGAFSGSRIMKCVPSVQKYLGITLLPQAGVALGMCIAASSLGEYEGELIRNIVLFGVLIYELIGPMTTKIALTKAGEIQPKGEEVLHRRENKLRSLKEGT
ncbi:MAG TPA: cation:proton antiporter [Oscillospiraceae bacterium]|nr:cation:proton antiporter [Oscillospiraceae bacterium]HQQ89429.1 cation:proton antiporter [Oscillospiraceae bacterium]HRW57518.1 cation:proton antiporter [Oscillospiraceae bacterium]